MTGTCAAAAATTCGPSTPRLSLTLTGYHRSMATKTKAKKTTVKKPALTPEEQRKQDMYERRQALRKLQGIEPQ